MVGCFGRGGVYLRCFGDCLTPHIFRRDRRPVRLASCVRGYCSSHLRDSFPTRHLRLARLRSRAVGVAAINLLVNPLLGVVLLALLVGVVLIAEGIVEIGLFFVLRQYRHSSLDPDRRSSHSGARDCRLRTLAAGRTGACSIPGRDQFHFERHFPPVVRLGHSRGRANRDTG